MLLKQTGIFFVLVVLGVISGCAGVISESIRSQVNEETTLKAVRDNPENHMSEMALWTGEIVGAKNEKEGTLIEILQKPADTVTRPKRVDTTEGRFLALYKGYLDVAIYKKGREVTVAGRITGQRVLPLGDIEYTYPLIIIEEIHLWSEKKEASYPHPYYGHPYWYRPYWWYW